MCTRCTIECEDCQATTLGWRGVGPPFRSVAAKRRRNRTIQLLDSTVTHLRNLPNSGQQSKAEQQPLHNVLQPPVPQPLLLIFSPPSTPVPIPAVPTIPRATANNTSRSRSRSPFPFPSASSQPETLPPFPYPCLHPRPAPKASPTTTSLPPPSVQHTNPPGQHTLSRPPIQPIYTTPPEPITAQNPERP